MIGRAGYVNSYAKGTIYCGKKRKTLWSPAGTGELSWVYPRLVRRLLNYMSRKHGISLVLIKDSRVAGTGPHLDAPTVAFKLRKYETPQTACRDQGSLDG